VARAYEAIVKPAATFSDPASEHLPVMSREEFACLLMDDVEWLEGYRREQACTEPSRAGASSFHATLTDATSE
jgi:hypothetical protein